MYILTRHYYRWEFAFLERAIYLQWNRGPSENTRTQPGRNQHNSVNMPRVLEETAELQQHHGRRHMHDLVSDVEGLYSWQKQFCEVDIILRKNQNSARQANCEEASDAESPFDFIYMFFCENLILRILPRVSGHIVFYTRTIAVIKLHGLRILVLLNHSVHKVDYAKWRVLQVGHKHRAVQLRLLQFIGLVFAGPIIRCPVRVVTLPERLVIEWVETDRVELLVIVVVAHGESLVQVRRKWVVVLAHSNHACEIFLLKKGYGVVFRFKTSVHIHFSLLLPELFLSFLFTLLLLFCQFVAVGNALVRI